MPLPSIVLFDLDDTLVDHSSALRVGAHALANAAHLNTDPEYFAARWKAIHAEKYPQYLRGELTYERMCRERIWEAIDPSLAPEAADSLFAIYMHAYRAAWRVFGDVLSCLDALSAYRLGVISNGRSEEQRSKLKVLGIEHRFRHVAVSEETGAAKPDPKIFLGACAAMGVTPESAVYVGDNYDTDYLAARAAGMSAVWLDRAELTRPADATVRISSLHELPGLLEAQRHSIAVNADGP
jgi:putative hydrolase of the HAD superfamily